MNEEDAAELKVLKDYALVRGELYRRMLGGVLSRCLGQEESCGSWGEVKLYRRLQRASFYWPNMGKDTNQIQTQCKTCQLAADKEESCTVFTNENSRSPFTQYLTKGILPQKYSKRYKLKRLATRYFLHNTVLFKKGYDGDPLRCLGPEEAKGMIKEVHSKECGKHQGKKKLYRCLLQMGLLLAYHKERYSRTCEKMP